VLVNGQFLIAKEDDQIFGESVVNFLELLVAERLCEINAMDLGTNCWRQLANLDGLIRHGHFLVSSL
jgi:hypothetical protein